jgi:tRNA (guanine26-N2/guanine27-N2)-dimethyltransferase
MSSENSIIDTDKLSILEEGQAKFYLFNKDLSSIPTKSMEVFYNKGMEINRDITCLAVETYSDYYNKKKLVVIDSMAGSGIGSIRILKECKNIEKIYINDINPTAKQLIIKNLRLNGMENNRIKIKVSRKDANYLLSEITNKYLTNNLTIAKKPNIISIDPFGTPNLYIDTAFKAIQKKGGFLCITATDTAVLFGVKPKACLRKYMAKPLHNEFCKEIGARILLYFLSRIANINGLGITPLLTFYHRHFIRIFLITFPEKKKVANQIAFYKFLIYCKKCGHRFIVQNSPLQDKLKCSLCGEKTHLDYAGPLWTGKIHDENFINKLKEYNAMSALNNRKKLARILEYCSQELTTPISYYNIHEICKVINSNTIPKMETLIETIRKEGYRASRTHFDFTSIKTDMDIDSLKIILLRLEKEV